MTYCRKPITSDGDSTCGNIQHCPDNPTSPCQCLEAYGHTTPHVCGRCGRVDGVTWRSP